MSEISDSGGGGNKKHQGKVKQKKSSTHIDMTPMVDLAFLLLTFFIMTTAFSRPHMMEIVLPDKNKEHLTEPPPVNPSRVLILLLGDSDKIYWYRTDDPAIPPKLNVTDFSEAGIRQVIAAQNRLILQLFPDKGMLILIKPGEGSKYKDFVDIFDEMNVDKVGTYAMVDITPTEEDLMKKYH